MTRIEMTNMMAAGIAIAEKREKLSKAQISCPNCNTGQVQLLDVDFQHWKCRQCHFKFDTMIVM